MNKMRFLHNCKRFMRKKNNKRGIVDEMVCWRKILTSQMRSIIQNNVSPCSTTAERRYSDSVVLLRLYLYLPAHHDMKIRSPRASLMDLIRSITLSNESLLSAQLRTIIAFVIGIRISACLYRLGQVSALSVSIAALEEGVWRLVGWARLPFSKS